MWCEGWPSRVALGTFWLGALGCAGAGRALLPALPLAALAAALGGVCSRSLEAGVVAGAGAGAGVRGPGAFARAWCALLGRLGALAGGARALAGTLDALSGGRARHWLFGEPPPPAAEPWPDPLAVAALALLCLMFMCGLENTTTFTAILLASVISGVIFFVAVGSLGINMDNWNEQSYLPNGWNGMILSAASCTYAFPAALPITGTAGKRLKCTAMMLFSLICMMAITAVFSMITPYREYSESAVPLVQVFESHPPPWARPVMASATVVALALAATELLPQAVAGFVTMAGPDWRVLTRVLAYESPTTGSPVLAVFSAGSLAAILAFACPMAHLVKLTCACQMLVWVLEAGHLLHLRCQPDHHTEDPADVRYKRLAGVSRPSRGSRLAAGLWFLPRSVRKSVPPEPPKTVKVGNTGEERECLLLDEYTASRTEGPESEHSEQSEVSEHQGHSSSDGESSTDIDAVVKEYKDRITVVSSVPDSSGGIAGGEPSAASGKRATAGAIIVVFFCNLVAIGIAVSLPLIVFVSIPAIVAGALLCWWQPVRGPSAGVLSCTGASLVCSVLATPLLADAWPAIVLFNAAGFVMYARRSTLCGANPRRRSRGPPLLGPRAARLSHLDTVYISR